MSALDRFRLAFEEARAAVLALEDERLRLVAELERTRALLAHARQVEQSAVLAYAVVKETLDDIARRSL